MCNNTTYYTVLACMCNNTTYYTVLLIKSRVLAGQFYAHAQIHIEINNQHCYRIERPGVGRQNMISLLIR